VRAELNKAILLSSKLIEENEIKVGILKKILLFVCLPQARENTIDMHDNCPAFTGTLFKCEA
jgi:hypothetical protein